MTKRLQPWLRYVGLGVLLGLTIISVIPGGPASKIHAEDTTLAVWWPQNGVHLAGTQALKATVDGLALTAYSMTWDVDDGTPSLMSDSLQDAPHKEAQVSLATWTWHGEGPYKLTFRARDPRGTVIYTQVREVFNQVAAPALTTPSPLPPPATPPASAPAPAQPSVDPYYHNPANSALTTAQAYMSGRPADAALLRQLGAVSSAQWFGGWNGNIASDVNQLVSAASASHKIPLMVVYNIPNRDCGSFSAGGATASSYGTWIRSLAGGLKGRRADIILEPDALAQLDCLGENDQTARLAMLQDAVTVLSASPQTRVYIDAGHAKWTRTDMMAARLQRAGIARASGFSLNVSNFIDTPTTATYGNELAAKVGNKHYLIDTSRNGNGPSPDTQWCNPAGRALGHTPTSTTGNPLIDAYVWAKTPGESDGACNGGPAAGVWWPEYALSLVRNIKP